MEPGDVVVTNHPGFGGSVDLGDERFGRIEIEEAVDHQHAIVADDETGVRAATRARAPSIAA